MNDLVSTIIPVFNRSDLLREAVQSVVEQTYRPVEVVIVDDGSTDDTPRVADELANEWSEVKTLHVKNGGPGRAREIGRRVSSGEYVQYLDSDDLLLPKKFEIQVEALRNRLDCGIAYGNTRLVDQDRRVLEAPFKQTGITHEHLFPQLLVERWWNTHTPLYRRSVCDAVGPWREDMWISEDWEYEARVGALGTRLVHCREYVCETRRHEGERLAGGPMSPQKARDTVRLLTALETCSRQAGVAENSPEMLMFSRWAFLVSRQAGATGAIRESNKALRIAQRTGKEANRIDNLQVLVYRAACSVFGWRTMGSFSQWLDQRFRSRSGGASRSPNLEEEWRRVD